MMKGDDDDDDDEGFFHFPVSLVHKQRIIRCSVESGSVQDFVSRSLSFIAKSTQIVQVDDIVSSRLVDVISCCTRESHGRGEKVKYPK